MIREMEGLIRSLEEIYSDWRNSEDGGRGGMYSFFLFLSYDIHESPEQKQYIREVNRYNDSSFVQVLRF